METQQTLQETLQAQPHKSKHIVVIPARIESTRLPRKLMLSDAGGIPVFAHTYYQAKKSIADAVYVATDSSEILKYCALNGIPSITTHKYHRNGTSRIAETIEKLQNIENDDFIVNVQADEPEIDPEAINELIFGSQSNSFQIQRNQFVLTLISPLSECAKDNPSVVKAILAGEDFDEGFEQAIFFTRKHIPYSWHHVGIYGYFAAFLRELDSFSTPECTKAENLEQINWLANYCNIFAGMIKCHAAGIDTREQYEAFVGRWWMKLKKNENEVR